MLFVSNIRCQLDRSMGELAKGFLTISELFAIVMFKTFSKFREE